MLDFDDYLTKHLKPCGRYQKFIIFLLNWYWFVCAFQNLSLNFIGATPKHHCKVPNHAWNDNIRFNVEYGETINVQDNETRLLQYFIPQKEDGSFEQCKVYRICTLLCRRIRIVYICPFHYLRSPLRILTKLKIMR